VCRLRTWARWKPYRGVPGKIWFHPKIPLVDQVGIRNDIRNRWDRTSVVEQFAFGLWNEFFLPSGATGTCVYVTKSWHQASAPHFTAWLVFLFDTPRRAQHWATAHVYLDFSESVCTVMDGARRCWVKELWAEDWQVWDVSTPCYRRTYTDRRGRRGGNFPPSIRRNGGTSFPMFVQENSSRLLQSLLNDVATIRLMVPSQIKPLY
jgi:hypothetical protein